MEKRLKATIKGINCEGTPFIDELEFLLFPPTEKDHYGTGYYMSVKFSKRPHDRQWVDVRYERTTNIGILANRWILSYYGKNAKEIIYHPFED